MFMRQHAIPNQKLEYVLARATHADAVKEKKPI